MICIHFLVCLISFGAVCSSPFGPVYPITAAWFKDRFSAEEWNATLTEFSQNGGDTVLLRAPSIVLTNLDELRTDPEFQWCYGDDLTSDGNRKTCYDEAYDELSSLGLNVTTFGKYLYEEDFDSKAMLQCPQYDRKIVTSRTYYILVLPLEMDSFIRNPCNLTGSKVMVLLTSFSGIDPHELLLRSAEEHNMTVYFGLPLPVTSFESKELLDIPADYELIRRITESHRNKYNSNGNLYTIIEGYTVSPPIDMVSAASNENLQIMKYISTFGKRDNKRILLNTYFQSITLVTNVTLDSYVRAFEDIMRSQYVDVISVQDGRGNANGGYFWQTQTRSSISNVDKNLYSILNAKFPNLFENVTFGDVFGTSINQMFYNLAVTRDRLVKSGMKTDLWLNIEAFSDLHDDPCLPVDKAGSGLDRMLDKVHKGRLDLALTHAGAYVQKVATLAWDPSFTCKTKNSSFPLSKELSRDLKRPIIANCSFHNSFNRSVVVIGYNLDGITQGFTVNWPNINGQRQSSHVYGYYFELDWGEEHNRVPSLEYTQLYDPYDIIQLAPKGFVVVSAKDAHHACAFKYDFTSETSVDFHRLEKMKRFFFTDRTPRKRLFGQNKPRRL